MCAAWIDPYNSPARGDVDTAIEAAVGPSTASQPGLTTAEGAVHMPAGWEQGWDTERQRYYYVDHNRGITHWEQPALLVPLPPPPPPPPLPPIIQDWEQIWDPAHCTHYYWNRISNKVTWVAPATFQVIIAHRSQIL